MFLPLVLAAVPVQQPPAATPAPAAQQPAPADEEGEGEDIVVTGSRRQPGAVIGDIPPDEQLGPGEIRSYGVNSVADLLTELGPQTRSGRGGAPVVLLNGKRISGFQEIRDLPTEAIQRVDILPEEVALKYGYRADSRVVNFVLRRRFRAATVEASDRIATEGGRNAAQGELDLLSILRDGRTNLHLSYQGATPLFEAERGILARAGDDGAAPAFDQTPFRTLLARTRSFSANAVHARPLLGASATFNARVETNDSRSSLGLPSAVLTRPDGTPATRVIDADGILPLAQRSNGVTAHLGATANGTAGGWQWSLTGNYDRADSETFTDTGVDASLLQAAVLAGDDPAAPIAPGLIGAVPGNRARSIASTGAADLLFTGPLATLPAGPITASLRAGASSSDLDSRSFRAATGTVQRGSVSRDLGSAQANIDLPVTRRTSAIGQLSFNGNAQVEQLSDFGTLVTTGYGVNWGPVEGVRLIASVTDEENAPTPTQLGAPVLTTPGVRVFDFTRGTTATVTTVTGGNPLLGGDNRHVERVGLTLKPWSDTDLVLTANYTRTRVDDPIRGFPAAYAALEAAFPDRFTRDAAGTLVRLDTRPVNLSRSDRSELRSGITFSKPIRSRIQRQLEAFRAGTGPDPFAGLRPPGGARAGGSRPPEGARGEGRAGGGGPGRFGGGGFGGRGGQGGGRLQFALYHTWHFTDRVRVADGGPVLDLLDGDAIGGGGGQPRHELEAQAGYTNNGLGARLSANYQNATRVNGAADADTLRFGSLVTANLRLFADLGGRPEWVRAHPWLRGARVTVGIDNLFDRRQRVLDGSGTTPISYQPAYLDALGRTVRVSLRKLFF